MGPKGILFQQISSFEKILRIKKNISIFPHKSNLDSETFWIFNNLLYSLNLSSSSQIVVIDVGSSDNWFSYVFQKFLPKATFVLFDALEYEKKYKIENSFFYNMLLGNFNGQKEFHKNSKYPGLSSVISRNNRYNYFEGDNGQNDILENIKISKLDDFMYKNHLNLIDSNKDFILKMDTQGSELEIIKGSTKLLKEKIAAVYFETQLIKKYQTNDTIFEIFSILTELDFIIYDINRTFRESNKNNIPFLGQLTEIELIFVKKKYVLSI
jgi:FkbM family methyltransferase